ncbi:MAG: OmpH family outer membrane protein [Acidobacteriia bacterium]|nr:OmpH family outer membrane protein [Terriglobia bacterium]
MTTKFVRLLLATVFTCSLVALAQAGNADSALPAAPSATPTPATAASPEPAPTGTSRIGTINIEQAIYASNEGQRDFELLSKKLEPKQTELKKLNDEVDSLKKQLTTSGDKLADDARASLVKQIEQKQKSLERSVQDARDDAQTQQNEIAQRILQKMAPVIVNYASTTGFGVIVDTSNPWPQGPVLWAAPSVDITRAIVEAYNLKSGVPAPAKPASSQAKPAGTGAAAKPAAPAATRPQTTTPPPPTK